MARTRGRTTVRREEENDDVDDATGVEKEKKAGRHPYFCNRRKGSKCVSSPRKLRRRRDAATPTTKEREEEQKRDGEADEIFRREVGDELGGICLYRNRGFVRGGVDERFRYRYDGARASLERDDELRRTVESDGGDSKVRS